jgi:hypothetical protein
MRRKKKERRGWRKKKREAAPPSSIPGFVAGYIRSMPAKLHIVRTIYSTPSVHVTLALF